MNRIGQLSRLIYINWILLRHGLDEIIFATHLFRPIRFLHYFLPWYWLRREDTPRAERIRRTLEDLGPLFVKFGQILSTRRDLLPDDIAKELTKLQDRVPAFPGTVARKIVEQAYGRPLHEVFQTFDETPFASASIAQVHAARLINGKEVIVKVVRPGIRKIIDRDVGLLYVIADLAERYFSEAKRLRPRAVVSEFEKTIIDELDMMREAASASLLKRNFSESTLLYIPEIYWPHTRKDVLVMERIFGTPISDIDSLKQQNIDLKKLSENGVEIFFTQVFDHNFFHADMHPGNIFVSPEGKYLAVDFGIMGSLSPEDQRYLAENFYAFFRRDYHRVAELHVESGWVPEGTRIDEFESAIRTVCEPIFEKPLKDISFGHLLLRLFQTASRFHMEIQPQLVLLQKTLLNIEGLGRQLNPELDLWQTAKPFLERWVSEHLGVRAIVQSLLKNAPDWAEKLPEIPALFYSYLKNNSSKVNSLPSQKKEINELRTELRLANRRTFLAITGSACILSAAVILGLDGYAPIMVADAPILSWLIGGFGVLILAAAWPSTRP